MNKIVSYGRSTTSDSFLNDLRTVSEVEIDLEIDLRNSVFRLISPGAGAVDFVAYVIILTAITNVAVLADIIHKHVQKIRKNKGEDIRIVLRDRISTDKNAVGVKDSESVSGISLKDKSRDEIKKLLEEESQGEDLGDSE